MRIESSVTSLSWIPSEAITGATRLPFDAGAAHYDRPPPDQLNDLEALRKADRFRFANELRAWIDVEGGRVVGQGQHGGGRMGSTTVKVGSHKAVFEAVSLPDRQPPPLVSDTEVTFTQTAGGRAGVPAPRRVRRAPFVQLAAPLVWTTLTLTIRADGSTSSGVSGASRFPRHWMYDHDGRLIGKTGLMDFKDWYRKAFGRHSPWGDEDSAALVTEVESALERRLSVAIMQGARPKIRKIKPGTVIAEQGAHGTDFYLVLDGVIRIEVDGERLVEVGPGALLGERAVLEGGLRTSTNRAVTKCKLAFVPGDQLDRSVLAKVSAGHRREDGS